MPAPVQSQAYLTTTPAGLRPLDISDEILKYRPEETTVLTLLMALNRVTVDDRVFRINIQDQDPGFVTITGVTAANTFTVSQSDAAYLFQGLTLRGSWNTTGVVSAVNVATGVVTLDGNFGTTAGWAVNQPLSLGARAVEELAQRPTIISRVPQQIENFVENSWDTYGQSRWVETVRFYGGNRDAQNREMCMYEHKRSIDRGLWFDAKGITTGPQGNTLYKTGGFMNMIATNIYDFGGSFTINKLRQSMTLGTRFMRSGTIWLFVSRTGWELIDRQAFNKGNVVLNGEKAYEQFYNIEIANFHLAGKRWKMMCVDHFEDSCADVMCAVDPAAVEIVTTRNQKTKQRQWMLERRLTLDNGLLTDGTVGDLYTDWGLRIQEKACMLLHGANTTGTEM